MSRRPASLPGRPTRGCAPRDWTEVEAETLAAIAAVASAGIAIGAAITAKRSADRSAAAEERSAKAAVRAAHAAERSAKTAEETLELDRERFAAEQDQRAEAAAPEIDIGEKGHETWTLAQQGRALVGFVMNF